MTKNDFSTELRELYDGEARNTGKELAAGFSGKSWGEVMSGLLDILGPAVQRYQEIFDSSPAEFKELANSMLIHEKALLNFVELELEGKPNSTNAMSDQLVYGLGKAT